MRKRFGFTLSEVLITLGIIGVVAALTIPVLINYFQEQVLLSDFQKLYSTLSQAYLSASQDNGIAGAGPTDYWTDQDAYNYIKPFLNVAQDCGFSSSCSRGVGIKSIEGVGYTTGSAYYGNYHLLLQNGAALFFYNWAGNGGPVVYVDVNGIKPPNQWGYDFFLLQFTSKNNAPFFSWYSPTWTTNTTQYCKKSTPYAGGWPNGSSCAYWILRHGNMDYLHRDVSNSEW